jgi:cysteine synthase A
VTDDEFMASFENCSLANDSFHHAGHVRMAFLYLCRYPALEALQRFSTALAGFANANGKPKLYHETITWAFLLLIRERLARAGSPQTWAEFAAANRDLLNWKDNILQKYYRRETLASELARTTFLGQSRRRALIMTYPNLMATVGKTPLVELGRMAKNLPGRVCAKLEMRNPCGSVKDRVGVALIEDAESRGLLKPGMTIVEATGGNTGVGLAFVSAIRGYRLILTMPETMSVERVALLKQLGAKVVLTPGILMNEAVKRANPEIHRRTTAIEIWEDTHGEVDCFVSAVGTGGTITGVGEVLKQRKPAVRVIAVEPANAAVLSGGPVGNHQIPGIGVGFIREVLNRSILDEVIAVPDAEAFACARRLAREEGIVAGASSGAALHAALSVAARTENGGRMIVVILADTGERYVTTSLFSA